MRVFAQLGNGLRLFPGQAVALSIVLLYISLAASRMELVASTKKILKAKSMLWYFICFGGSFYRKILLGL